VRRPLSLLALLAIAPAALAAIATAAAAAPTITDQGTAAHPFTFQSMPASLELVDGGEGDKDLQLALTGLARIGPSSPVYGGVTPDPRSVEALDDGNLLFADRNLHLVAETTRAGTPEWTYSAEDDPDLQHPFSAQRFTRDGQELTLIADRWAYRVWAVDRAKNVVWQYGVTNERGAGVNQLTDPFYARYSADSGTVLIADCNENEVTHEGGHRVIEVRYADYQAGAPDNGFTERSIVWSYGTAGTEGTGPGLLDKPHSVQRLAGGNVLIADADPARVIEVDRATKRIVWQYGTTNEPGAGANQLDDPNFAARLSGGDTLIVDTGNARVIRVTADGEIAKSYDMAADPPAWVTNNTPAPRQAAYTSDGLLAVADNQFTQLVLLGYARSAQTTSTPLDCRTPEVTKAFVKLTWKGDTGQSGTKVSVDYRLDDGSKWMPCKGIGSSRAYDFPAGTVGKTIAYRITLSTTDYGHTPRLDAIVIQSTKAKTGSGGGGGGGDKPEGSGNSGQSGVYTYPSTAEGGTGTSGTGSGSGSSGGGSGSSSYGSGTSSAGAGSGATSTTNALDVPVQSTGSGSVQPVQGYQVQGEEGVRGVPLRAAEGPQVAPPERPGPSIPVLALIGGGIFVAATLFVPWPFVAAHLRRITGFDHTRPARSLPFRPLGK